MTHAVTPLARLVAMVAGVALLALPMPNLDAGAATRPAADLALGDGLPAGWTVVIERGDSPHGGIGSARDGVIRLWVDHIPADSLRSVYLHELGHAWDYAKLTGADRREWVQLRGLRAADDWWLGDVTSPHRVWADIPAEDFAEAYAYCADPQPEHYHAALAPPTVDQCQWIAAKLH